MYKSMKDIQEKKCPKSSTWRIISKNKESILYERQAKPCMNFSNEHEIAKIIYGRYNIFRASYTMKKYQMPVKQRSEWLEVISAVKIILQR